MLPLPRSPMSQLVTSIINYINQDLKAVLEDRESLLLPSFPTYQLIEIINAVTQIFKEEPVLLELQSPYIVVGDLHGHIIDLIYILRTCGLPPMTRYLFLGDFVDRGEYSLEILLFVYILKAAYPHKIHIIRGNHEFEAVCHKSTFPTQLQDIYKTDEIFKLFLSSFAEMPLAAVVDDKYFCVHGGIGPTLTSLDQIRSLQRPIFDFDDELVQSLVWSDPGSGAPGFLPSQRGKGYSYGSLAVRTFLSQVHLKQIVRGHECVEEGVDIVLSKKVITVFSASNYSSDGHNRAGVLFISGGSEIQTRLFGPLRQPERITSLFEPVSVLREGMVKKQVSLSMIAAKCNGSFCVRRMVKGNCLIGKQKQQERRLSFKSSLGILKPPTLSPTWGIGAGVCDDMLCK